MGQSSQYPMWLGRTVAFAYELWLTPSNDDSEKTSAFVKELISSLPPPGTCSDEAWSSQHKSIKPRMLHSQNHKVPF